MSRGTENGGALNLCKGPFVSRGTEDGGALALEALSSASFSSIILQAFSLTCATSFSAASARVCAILACSGRHSEFGQQGEHQQSQDVPSRRDLPPLVTNRKQTKTWAPGCSTCDDAHS